MLVKTDTISRLPSTAANGTLLTGYNVNSGSSTAPALQVTSYNVVGAMTIPASGTAARIASRIHIPTGLHVVGDAIEVQFGDITTPGPGGLTGATRTSSSAPGDFVVQSAPVVIGPQQYGVIHRWSLTEAAAPSYELELDWIEA